MPEGIIITIQRASEYKQVNITIIITDNHSL